MTLSAKKGRGSGLGGGRVPASQPLVPQPLVQFTVWQGRPQHECGTTVAPRPQDQKNGTKAPTSRSPGSTASAHRLTGRRRRFAAQRATPRRAVGAAASGAVASTQQLAGNFCCGLGCGALQLKEAPRARRTVTAVASSRPRPCVSTAAVLHGAPPP